MTHLLSLTHTAFVRTFPTRMAAVVVDKRQHIIQWQCSHNLLHQLISLQWINLRRTHQEVMVVETSQCTNNQSYLELLFNRLHKKLTHKCNNQVSHLLKYLTMSTQLYHNSHRLIKMLTSKQDLML